MTATVTTHPENNHIYARNTVPTVTVTGCAGEITAELWVFGDNAPTYVASYLPDFADRVRIDFRGLYEDYMRTDFPLAQVSETQFSYMIAFSMVVKEGTDTLATYDYYVANALLNSSTAFQDWAAASFLTNQPLEKRTTMDAPEFLTWLDATYGDLTLKALFYPKSGGVESVTVLTETATGCRTVNVGYKRLIHMSQYLPGQLKGYYDIALFDGKGTELCRQRYVYKERTGRESYYCVVNALGGIDTLTCLGENTLQPEMALNTGLLDGGFTAIDDMENHRSWLQLTGQMPWRERDWLYELMDMRQGSWKYDGTNYIPIVVTGAEIGMGDSKQTASASFTYRLRNATRAISDTERAVERTLHASVAGEAEELDDLTAQAVLAFSPSQGGGYATEAVAIPASRVYVTVEATSTVYVIVNGSVETEIDPASRMPVVVEIDPGDEVSFDSQDEIVTVTVNYYPDETYLASQTAPAQEQTES